MSKLRGITVQFDNRDSEFYSFRDLFDTLDLADPFNEASNFHVAYSNNNVPEAGETVEAPMIGQLRVEQERECQINLDAGYWIKVNQTGKVVTLNVFTGTRTGAEQIFADGKVQDLNGSVIDRNPRDAEMDYKELVSVLDRAPEILGWSPR